MAHEEHDMPRIATELMIPISQKPTPWPDILPLLTLAALPPGGARAEIVSQPSHPGSRFASEQSQKSITSCAEQATSKPLHSSMQTA